MLVRNKNINLFKEGTCGNTMTEMAEVWVGGASTPAFAKLSIKTHILLKIMSFIGKFAYLEGIVPSPHLKNEFLSLWKHIKIYTYSGGFDCHLYDRKLKLVSKIFLYYITTSNCKSEFRFIIRQL